MKKSVSSITDNTPPPNKCDTSSLAHQLMPNWQHVKKDFFKLTPTSTNPVLTAKNVTDRKAKFIADPFLFYDNDYWYMFFEVLSHRMFKKGEIGLASSKDGLSWNYQRIVLSENFHLSFPYVFKWNSTFYMIPETKGTNQVRLYKATNFPYTWVLDKVLISGVKYVDSSIFRYMDKWWMFTSDSVNLFLYHSTDLTTPSLWKKHPISPIVSSRSKSRSAGRVVVFNENTVIRLAQKNNVTYGESIRAFEIDELTATSYKEHEIEASPLLKSTAKHSDYNYLGMHTLDPWWTGDHWLAAVDGLGKHKKWSIAIYTSS
jgi:hypothetical protein